MKKLISVERLSVQFTTKKGMVTAIDDISFQIGEGETVCLVGESGSGKSVTAKSIMQLIGYEHGVISGGKIILDGEDLTKLPEKQIRAIRGKKVAMVFQEPMVAFDPVFTIGSQIIESIVWHESANKEEAWKKAVLLLERVGIPEAEIRMKQYPGEMSGGMLQRAMIAMALSGSPRLLIADEPTTALDMTIQAQILRLLQELKEEFHMSILLITHDLGIAAEMADKVIVMYSGRIVEESDAGRLFGQPCHPYTRGLLESIPDLDCKRTQKLNSIKGFIPSLSQLPEGCRFHPRCFNATEKCRKDPPPFKEFNDRRIACWSWEKFVNVPIGQEGRPTPHTPSGFSENDEQVYREEKSESLFEIVGLKKYYSVGKGLVDKGKPPIRAVDGVTFSIEKGETFGLVGESGSGKSTLGRVLVQLEKATAGEVRFQGQDLSQFHTKKIQKARQDMQVIFQDPYGSMDPRWRVGKIISEPLMAHMSLNKAEQRERVEELLEVVGLNPALYDRFPHEFSGGQRQRICIARAIALKSRFILADEAVSALDVSVQAQIINLMRELQKKLGLTYLFIAHGLNIVRYLSDRIGVMYLGKLVEIAPSDDLFAHPAHHYTQGLLASIPSINQNRKKSGPTIRGEIPSPTKPPSGCRFHTRCPAATPKCAEEEPVLTQIGRSHLAACHYPL